MAKEVLTTGEFTFNAVAYGVTSMEITKTADEVDTTDTQTSGNEREYLGGRQARNFTIEMWKDITAADPPLSTEYAGALDFEGFTYAGNMILLEIVTSAQIDNAVKLTVNGRTSGTITETPGV